MPDKDDIKLAIAASKGDTESFEKLVNIYYKGILSVCFSVLSNMADAQDCTQETFIKAYKNISRYNSSSSFFTWIYRIAVNTSYDHIRKEKRRPAVSLDETFENDENRAKYEPEDNKADIHDELVRKISDQKVYEIIYSLPERYSRILIMKDIQGLSYKEICEIEKINEGTLKSRLFRARAAFGKKAKKLDLY